MNYPSEVGSNPGLDNGQTSESEIPTNANSTKQPAPELEPGLNSPAPTGDACC